MAEDGNLNRPTEFAAPVMWWRLLSGATDNGDRAVGPMTGPAMIENMQRHMQQMLNGTLGMSHIFMPWWSGGMIGDLSVDIVESMDNYRITADIPDREMRNIEISVTKDALVISGESAHVEMEENERFLRRERAGASFSRTINLPPDADFDKARAVYEGNMLTIEVPRRKNAENAVRKLRVVQNEETASNKSAAKRKTRAPKSGRRT